MFHVGTEMRHFPIIKIIIHVLNQVILYQIEKRHPSVNFTEYNINLPKKTRL